MSERVVPVRAPNEAEPPHFAGAGRTPPLRPAGPRPVGPPAPARRRRAPRLDPVVLVVVGGIVVAVGPDWSVLGFALKGWAWVLAIVVAGGQLLRSPRRVRFPLLLWAPWVVMLLIYLGLSPYENAVQRTAMLVCPVLVGAAASTLVVDDRGQLQFFRLLRWAAVALFLLSLARLGVFATGQLPSTSALAPQAMTAALLAAFFVASSASGAPRALRLWLLMTAIPVLGVTRTGIVATASTLPATLARIGVARRLVAAALIAAAGLAVFNLPRVQRKMFYSGSGTLGDLRTDNPNLASSGRFKAWNLMELEIERKPWFGHGANAQEEFLLQVYGIRTQPHNDWLRLEFDYGYVGTALFAVTMLGQAFLAWRAARRSRGAARVLFLAAASAFVPYTLFMFTDNIILYAVFFGNPHFLMLGLAYAARPSVVRTHPSSAGVHAAARREGLTETSTRT